MRELSFEPIAPAPGNVTKGLLHPEGKPVFPEHALC